MRVQAALRMRGYLDEIARQQAEMDDLRRQMDRLAQRMAEDLRLAAGVQRSLLPPPVDHTHLDLAREFMPFRDIGGDYYDFVPLGPQRPGARGRRRDGEGRARRAAGGNAQGRRSARSCRRASRPGASSCRAINRMFWEVTPSGLFASLFFGVFDASGRSFEYVNAGHYYPFVLRRDGDVRATSSMVAPCWAWSSRPATIAGRSRLGAGRPDRVLHATASPSAANPEGEHYGVERLKDAARRSRTDPARISLYSMLGEVQGWSGGLPPEDDATLIVVKVR